MKGFKVSRIKARESIISRLKNLIRRKVDSELPGYLTMIDSISMRMHGKRFLDLFFESPCKAYGVVREYYGDESTADFTMLRLFLRPLAVALNDIMLEDSLLMRLKKCDDNGFLELLMGRSR